MFFLIENEFYTSKFSFATPFTLQLKDVDGDGEEEGEEGIGREAGRKFLL